jgi:hypothetical protein
MIKKAAQKISNDDVKTIETALRAADAKDTDVVNSPQRGTALAYSFSLL